MTIKEAYRKGFATRCAELGITPVQLEEAFEKYATSGVGGEVVEGGKDLLKWLSNKGLSAAVAASIGLPAIAGYGLAATQHTSKADIDALKNIALIHDYEQAVHELRRRKKSQGLLPKISAMTRVPTHTNPQVNLVGTPKVKPKHVPGPIMTNIEKAKKKIERPAPIPTA